MSWSKEQIENHKKACDLLYQIMHNAFEYIGKNKEITEYQIQQFILNEFKRNKMKIDRSNPFPIVAFDQNSAIPHYFPAKKSKKLKPNTFILIDIWARLARSKAPFADITWLAHYGKSVPKEVLKIFKKTIGVRDNTINFIKSNLKKRILPIGKEVDLSAIKFISKEVHKDAILHRTGHSIGTLSPHGVPGHLSIKNNNRLEKNLGYTIEPGIYLKNKFGMRSEINFYIDEKLKMNITTKMQKELIIIK